MRLREEVWFGNMAARCVSFQTHPALVLSKHWNYSAGVSDVSGIVCLYMVRYANTFSPSPPPGDVRASPHKVRT